MIPVVSGVFVRLLLRMALRVAVGGLIDVAGRLGKQLIGHIVRVMPTADGDAVADPLADCVLREGHRPFLLTRLPKRLP